MINETFSRKAFLLFNAAFLTFLALICILPIIHVIAISFSSANAANSGWVKFWPIDPTLASYKFVAAKSEFWRSFQVSFQRLIYGTGLNMLLTVLTAYPLSKEAVRFKARTFYVWIFVFTMLFGGGLIPTYMIVFKTGLIDSIWALVLPGAIPVFNLILLINFFRALPHEMEEAAFIDGAGHWTTLWRIYLPLSTPALATLTLFALVGHWNAWFDGLIYMNFPENYPVQSYLKTLVINTSFYLAFDRDPELMRLLSDRSLKAAQIFLTMIPILLVYPFLQRYFVKGIVMGSVKQ